MDMDGKFLHRWRCDMALAWSDLPASQSYEDCFRRAYMYPNGELLAIHEGVGIIKLGVDSQLIWKNPNQAHHDLEVLPDGSIYVLTRKAHIVPRIHPEKPILEDFVTLLDGHGQEQHSFSILEAFERSEFREDLGRFEFRDGDIFHTNTIEVLGEQLKDRHPAFSPGNLLVSFVFSGGIAVIDPLSETVVWYQTGGWRRQHQPEALTIRA